MSLNQKQLELMYEWMKAHSEFKEKVLWIGCNPSDPEMFKQQADDGFKLMAEFSKYTTEMLKKIEEAKEETFEDRFNDFLTNTEELKTEISEKTGIPKVALFGKVGKPLDLIVFNPNGSKRIVEGDPVDKVLNQAGLTNAEKLIFKFEKDFPHQKALFEGKVTFSFREWLVRHNLYDDYFKHGDYKDEPI